MKRGLSLLELLIVLAVFGILAAIGVIGLLRYRDTVALKQAAVQVATDLEHARSLARRTSLDQAFEPVIANNSYTITSQASKPVVTSYALPSGVSFKACSSGDDNECTKKGVNITFKAPYGTTGATPTGLVLHNRSGELEVNVLGIGGKVVVRAP